MIYCMKTVFEDVTKLLKSHPGIREGDIANKLGYERHTIEKAIQLQARLPFRRWRRDIQMHWAAEVIERSNILINQVAFEFGYRSPRAFSRAFRASIGVAPAQYRRTQNRQAC